MKLHKLYSKPKGLFEPIKFKNGVNFIFGKKDTSGDTKKSLNGIGKSLLLNFLDFALLSSKTPHLKSALANNDIEHYSIVLEFYIGEKLYFVERPLKNENKNIILGEQGHGSEFESIKDAKTFLCDLVFQDKKYKGKYSNTWLRKLMPFFIKKQEDPKTKVNFLDPIKYSRPVEMELIPYHLFFLGINNILFWKNFEIKSELKIKGKAEGEIKDLVTETYGLKDIPQAENTIDKLKGEISIFENNIDKFKLAEQYKDTEEESNTLTLKIKDLWYKNHLDRKRVDSYKNSYEIGDTIKTIKIKNLYKELNELLASNIKRTLDEALKFRKNISESRKEFLSSEITSLEKVISERTEEINEYEKQRAKLFEFLQAKQAIKDLSEAYLSLSKKREQLSDLEGKIKLYQDLNKEITERETEIAKLFLEITNFAREIQKDISNFRNVFFEVHNSIYPENKHKDFGFKFTPNNKKDSKIDMEVYLSAGLAKGKNFGRTLIYDLSILFYIIEKERNLPRFLVHDGIFDGMDPAHFVALYKYLQEKAKTTQFQYIITLNEEGELDGRFGDTDIINSKKIDEESIITLTPETKLLNNEWD